MDSRNDGRAGNRLHLFAAAIFLAGVGFLPVPVRATSDVEMTGFRIVQETGSGRWEIQAGRATYDRQGDVLLDEVVARLMSGNQVRVRVVSERGRYDSGSLVLYLEGNVGIASLWGSRLQTSQLRWDGRTALLSATGGVKMQRGGLHINGQSLRYTASSGTAFLSGGVLTTWDERSFSR